jgi:hydroxyacylglutathione hydrolase
VEELVRDLAGIGLDRVAGYFGVEVITQWQNAKDLQHIPSITLTDVVRARSNGELLLDVRGAGEWSAGHLPGALNVPVGELDQRLGEIPRERPLIVHCQTGARAAIAASLLRARGYANVQLFSGGFAQWREAGQPVET